MPKIVYDELAAVYERELLSRLNQFLRAKGSLTAILTQAQVADVDISVESEVVSYLNHVKEILSVEDKDIFDYKETYLHDVIERAIRRKRPCTERGEEIRDAVLWHSVLDIAQESPGKTVVFISQNTKQFTLSDDTLHPELIQDCADHGITVKYFVSLDSFAKQHAVNIEFITKEWLMSSIDIDDIIVMAHSVIETYAERSLNWKLFDSFSRRIEERSSTGYFNPTQGSLDIETFYVYEMTDGSFRVEAVFTGEVEVECEVERITRKEVYDYEYDFASREYEYMPTTRYRNEIEPEYIYVYPQVTLNIEIIIRDKLVNSLKFVEG